MLNQYVDNIYVINLDKRTDRLEKCTQEFEKIGTSFQRIAAIDGSKLDIDIKRTQEKRWNNGAYALAKTTIGILEDAMAKGYEKILICEDDIEFHPLFDVIIQDYMERIPIKFDMAFLGYTPTGYVHSVNSFWDKIYSGFSCHAYIISKHIFPLYKKLLENLDNPIDFYTNRIMGGRMNSIAAHPYNHTKLIYQYSGESDIEGGFYNTDFTR